MRIKLFTGEEEMREIRNNSQGKDRMVWDGGRKNREW